MEPDVPSQGSAKWLSYLGCRAESSTWVKSVQAEHWKVVFCGRVVCSPHLSVAVVSAQQLICTRCVKHQILNASSISCVKSRGCAVGLLGTLGCKVWELLVFGVTFFARDFLRSVLPSSSGAQGLWFHLLWESGSTDTPPVPAPVHPKVVTSFYLRCSGAVAKTEVPSLCAAALSCATVTPSSRELQKILAWSCFELVVGCQTF